MVQIARTHLPPNQVFYIALSRIFGIGKVTGLEVAESCGISKEMKVWEDIKHSRHCRRQRELHPRSRSTVATVLHAVTRVLNEPAAVWM
jgi:hypothetical protein